WNAQFGLKTPAECASAEVFQGALDVRRVEAIVHEVQALAVPDTGRVGEIAKLGADGVREVRIGGEFALLLRHPAKAARAGLDEEQIGPGSAGGPRDQVGTSDRFDLLLQGHVLHVDLVEAETFADREDLVLVVVPTQRFPGEEKPSTARPV